LIQQEQSFSSLDDVEALLNELLMQADDDPNSENADLSEMHLIYMQHRNAYIERKKIRDIENVIVGAQNYLSVFNEGNQKSNLVERVAF